MPNALDVTTPSDREILVTRVFDAPRALVFEAHVNPDLLKRWMLGPPGWIMPVCEIDLRVGGAYRHVWRNEESGEQFAITGTYREIAPPERIVTVEQMEGAEGEALCTLVLTEQDGKTTMTQTMAFASKDARDSAIATGMAEGMAHSYDLLDTVLSDPQ